MEAPALSITEQLAHSTVRIETNVGTGTGFFYQFGLKPDGWHIPAIVTNKHVVEGTATGTFLISRGFPDGRPDLIHHETYTFGNFQRLWLPHSAANIDLCAMPIAPILKKAEQDSVRLFFRALPGNLIPTTQELEDLNPVEDITMIGYPNGLWDRVHNMPIFRRGITATHPKLDWNGNPEFLIDAACFPGSSGSPVFLLTKERMQPKTEAPSLAPGSSFSAFCMPALSTRWREKYGSLQYRRKISRSRCPPFRTTSAWSSALLL